MVKVQSIDGAPFDTKHTLFIFNVFGINKLKFGCQKSRRRVLVHFIMSDKWRTNSLNENDEARGSL